MPAGARARLIVATPCLVAAWAFNGLYLSLGPSLAVQVFASPSLLWGGLVIFLLMAAGAVATVVLRTVSSPVTMLSGCLALVGGTVVTIVAIETSSGAAFLAGAALAGAGFGAAVYLGAHRARDHACSSEPARRRGRGHLHPLVSGVQYPRRNSRAGNDAFWPARHRAGLFRSTCRACRPGGSELYVPPAARRHDVQTASVRAPLRGGPGLRQTGRARSVSGASGDRQGADADIQRQCRRRGGASFSNTATWVVLSDVNGDRSQPAQRSRNRKPPNRAMRSSSDGQTYRKGPE